MVRVLATRPLATLALVGSIALLGCDKAPPPAPAPTPAPSASAARGRDDVVAIVNGVPITDADVKLKLKVDMHGAEDKPLHRKNAVEALIQAELLRQKAASLGLEQDPAYQRKLRGMEAQMASFQRSELAEVFFRREIAAKAEVSDAEARAYFAANEKRIKTETHVLQILRVGDDAALERDLAEVKKGTPFEEVAKKQFPKVPEGQKPWDLGLLTWSQIPEPWQKVIDALAPGQTSEILRGPKGRAWIIHVVKRRVDDAMTFERAKGPIVEAMRAARIEELRAKSDKSLRDGAKIEWVKPDAKPEPEE